MKQLNIPIIKDKKIPDKWLTMDDYLEFVMLNLKYTIKNKKAVKEWKKLLSVTVPFTIKG